MRSHHRTRSFCLGIGILALLLRLRGCAMPPATATEKLNWPLFKPLVLGREVRLQIVSVNQARMPDGVMPAVARRLQQQVAGAVRVVDLDPVQLPADKEGKVCWNDACKVLTETPGRGPMTITLVVTPGLSDYSCNAVCIYYRGGPYGQTGVLVDAGNTGDFQRKLVVYSRAQTWELVTIHEIYHGLGVPLAADRRWDGGHCTHPECILYPRVDARSFITGMLRWGPPRDLCPACMAEIRKVRMAAGNQLMDPDASYDPMTFYDESVQVNPDKAQAYVMRAEARGHMNDPAGEVADVEKAVQLDPKEPALLNHLAWLLSTCPEEKLRDGRRAVTVATHACELTGWKEAYCIDTLGAAYAEAGDFTQAVSFQKQAIDLMAKEPDSEEYVSRLQLYEAHQAYRNTGTGD